MSSGCGAYFRHPNAKGVISNSQERRVNVMDAFHVRSATEVRSRCLADRAHVHCAPRDLGPARTGLLAGVEGIRSGARPRAVMPTAHHVRLRRAQSIEAGGE